ncbi:MAG: PEGA domain-containing protein [Pseudomonadota bacterium]
MAHSVSRSQLYAGLLAAALMAIGSPALAAKKKKSSEPAGDSEAGLPSSGKSGDGAAQAADTERPKPILEEAPGPEEDAQGNVKFVGNKTGKGKITVRAPKKEKAKIYLEGRYFGVAPKTINGIPPGDYIVEVNYPNGKSVTKPVSVSGDEEALIELGGASEVAAPAEKPMTPETIEKRLSIAKVVGIGAIGLAAVAVGLGVWEYTVQKDYDKKFSQGSNRETLDALIRKGDTLALSANICFVGAAAGLIAAGVIAYPAYKARKNGGRSESPDSPPPVSFMFGPGRTLGSVNAGMVYHF